jgi:RND family efflux transporter MFP subunit
MNTEQKGNQPQRPTDANTLTKSKLRMMMNFLIPIVIVAAAALFFKYQMDTRPKASRTPPTKQAKLVEVVPLQRTNEIAVIPLMGKVIPSRQITLGPEVTGVINVIDPVVVPGGVIQKGQTLFKIDSRDYETIVKQRQGNVAQAMLSLKLESGNQAIAQQEYEMLEEVIEEQDTELLLRKPHLQQTQANFDAAQAMLEQAQLNVRRCTIKVPFNAIIEEKYIDIGGRVSPSSSLVSITGIDEYWIEVPVPENQLRWIQIPRNENQTGSPVKIYNSSWKDDQFRKGNVIRLLGQLEEQARRAQLLVSVKDPLCLQDNFSLPKLLIGSYVRVHIEGIQLSDVFQIKREYLRDGEFVFIMNAENKLEIRPVEIIFRGDDIVYIKNGLAEGECLIITDLSAPVEGMDLRLEEMKSEGAGGESHG